MTTSASGGTVSIRSPYAFAETVQRLLSAFASHSLKVFATIDQRAEAAAVGLKMPPATLVLFGNPRVGTPLMVEQPLSALDLPLKVLVTESSPGEVMVSFNAAAYIVGRHSLSAELLNNLVPAERVIAEAITK
ncbi:MAG TPA: DUF302 domain-containing protein [Casimicrobiaceae bacterium]|nr:DUF302 domain-containing protein [Casimicrobiaceae bacterium]